MTAPSTTHLVLIPSYNTGAVLRPTVEAALAAWTPVWVVIDGSTDGSERPLLELTRREPGLRVLVSPENEGKGAAIQRGAAAAAAAGFTHALLLDSDGQHPAESIRTFMAASAADPAAMILGRPVFGPDAPRLRRWGRQLSVGLAALEVLGPGIADPLFGFRLYPLAPLLEIFRTTRGARRFDFDHETAVRLFWRGVRPRNLAAPCRYLPRGAGGVSHFHYGRDNLRLVGMHLRLLAALCGHLPRVIALRRRWSGDYNVSVAARP
jgi:glycosyltransferase involved in cell wall biosynthesis